MSRSAEKNWKGDSLVSPGMVCYAEKQVKPFWSSSLGQMVQFDTIIFCRTFKNYFGQFVWIEKKKKKRKVTIIVAFHFMKRRLKKKSHYNSRVSLHEAPTKNTVKFYAISTNVSPNVELEIFFQQPHPCLNFSPVIINILLNHCNSIASRAVHIIRVVSRLIYLSTFPPFRFLFQSNILIILNFSPSF